MENNQNYDAAGNANHYKSQRIDLQHQMESIWGTFQLMTFCEMSAFCYRMRAGKKKGNDIQQEITKAEWFEERAKFLLEKIRKGMGIVVNVGSNYESPLEPEFLEMLEKKIPVEETEAFKEFINQGGRPLNWSPIDKSLDQ